MNDEQFRIFGLSSFVGCVVLLIAFVIYCGCQPSRKKEPRNEVRHSHHDIEDPEEVGSKGERHSEAPEKVDQFLDLGFDDIEWNEISEQPSKDFGRLHNKKFFMSKASKSG